MNKEIRESSVDKGWKSMRSMLDVEMPRDNKRRPLLWWWLLAASVAGVVSFRRLSVPPNQQKNEPVLQQPVAPAPVASVRQDFQPAAAGAGSLRFNSTDIPQSAGPVERNDSGVLRAGQERIPSFNGTEAAMTTSNHGTDQNGEADVIKSQIICADNMVMPVPAISSPYSIEMIQTLDQISSCITSSGIGERTAEPAVTSIIDCKETRHSKGRIGVAAGVIAGSSMNGASLGLICTRYMGRRFALRGGLSLATCFPDKDARPVLSFSDQDYLGATKYAFESSDLFGNTVQKQDVFTQVGQSVAVPVERWLAAEITAMVQYKLTRKIWLQTGAVGSLTITSVISPLNYTGGLILQPDESALNSLETLADPATRRFVTDVTGGISWFSGRHLEWGAGIRLPVNTGNIRYRKVMESSTSVSNVATDNQHDSDFTKLRNSPLFTASVIWNF
jgi:hypothetical protein